MTTSTLNLNRKYTGKSLQNSTKNIPESGFPFPQVHTRPEEKRGILSFQMTPELLFNSLLHFLSQKVETDGENILPDFLRLNHGDFNIFWRILS